LLMGHIWVIIANTIKGSYYASKVSDTILANTDDGSWQTEINTDAAWSKLNEAELEENE